MQWQYLSASWGDAGYLDCTEMKELFACSQTALFPRQIIASP